MTKITNNSQSLQGINSTSGDVVYLQPGETRDISVDAGEMGTLKAHTFLGIEGVDRGRNYPPEQNGAPPATGFSAYAVKETSPGWFVVTRNDVAATKKLRKADADGFESLSDEAKAAFVEANAPES